MTLCSSVANVTLTLHGPTWLDDLVQDIEKRLHDRINKDVEGKVCSFLSQVDSVFITGLIQDLNAELIGFITPPPPVLPPVPVNVVLSNLVNNSVVNLLEFIVQRVLGPTGLNTALRIINMSSFEFDLSTHKIAFPIFGSGKAKRKGKKDNFWLCQLKKKKKKGRNGNVSALVNSVVISGVFDSWRNFSLSALSEYEVGFDAVVEGPLLVNLSVSFNSSIASAGLSSDGLIQLELRNVSLQFIGMILANQTYYDGVSFEDLESLACAGQGILNASLLQLLASSTLSSFQIDGSSNSSALGSSFMQMIDRIVAVALSNYAQFLSPLLDFVVFDTIGRTKVRDGTFCISLSLRCFSSIIFFLLA